MARILDVARARACKRALWTALLAVGVFLGEVRAEPYIAVMTGFKCGQCHTNATGGGKRTAFGTAYAHNELARRVVTRDGDGGAWTGEVNRWLAFGADLRAGFDYVDTPGADETNDFDVSRATLYAELRAIPGLLSFYVDEQVAPGGTLNREAYALLTPQSGKYTVKAGKLFLPYGWRLQDDSAFVRSLTGVNLAAPDNGVELGLELPRWSTQLAITNGTAGGPENDTGKQVTGLARYVGARWTAGLSASSNNADLGDREMYGAFAGLRTGPIAWLAEVDRITDDTAGGGDTVIDVSLLEGNWRLAKGHNLKLTYEFHDPADDADEDERERYSLIWEYSPFQLLQSRIGIRAYNGVPGAAATNRDELFAELHVYF